MEETEHKVNKKKVLITVLILLIMVLLIIYFFIIRYNKNAKVEETSALVSSTQTEATADANIPADTNTSADANIPAGTNTSADMNISANANATADANATANINTIVANSGTVDANNSESEVKAIYLTFDDGPSLDTTPKILDILKQEGVKATFFVVNYSKDEEDLIKREVQEGHSIGIHGYSHKYKEIYQSEETYLDNLSKLQEKLEKTIGSKITITRFPGGSSNTISSFNKGIMTRLTAKVEEIGYKYYDWNIDSDDAGSAKTKEDVYNNVIQNLKKKKTNVVLMHDFTKNEKTIDALKDIIEYGKANGYEFKTITEDGSLVMHHHINN